VRTVGLVRDPVFLLHVNPAAPVESPARVQAIDRMLAGFTPAAALRDLPARDATFAELARVHDEDYIRTVENTRLRDFTPLDPDTAAGPRSHPAAVRAAGAALTAVEAVMAGTVSAAFSLARPPGHHAERGHAMGFCLFNNVAVAARHARAALGVPRVAIVDWDVHHGNGTMHTFYDAADVLFISSHQYPYYPGTGRLDETGRGPGQGFTINLPLPGGQGDADFEALFTRVVAPALRRFNPGLILVSAGFDIASGDPLGGMQVTPRGFARMTEILQEVSQSCCDGKIVFVLEGGYDLGSLASGVEAVLGVLTQPYAPGPPGGPLPGAVLPSTEDVIRRLRDSLGA
jgi:acetoin utilization deacetylase AcuC-like enzyme